MKRRELLKGGAIAGLAGLAAGCECGVPVMPGDTQTRRRERLVRMVTTWPRDFPGLGFMAERTAQAITRMSGGSMRVQLFAAGELVPAFEAFDAVSSGAADIYHGAEYYWVGKSPAFAFFTAVPFGMTASEIMAWTEYGGGQQLWDRLSAKFNIKPFVAGNTGHQLAGWYRKEIRSVEDLRGMKIRMPGLGGEVLRRLGAAAVAISGGEIYQALQSGAIDGTEWVGPWNDLAFGLYRQAPYYYWPGFHEPGGQLAAGINLDLWNSLDSRERTIIRGACQQATYLSIAEYMHYNSIALEQLVNEHGVQLRRLPDDVLAALARETGTVLEEAAAYDALAGEVYESYRTSFNRLLPWERISDQAYMNARSSVFRP